MAKRERVLEVKYKPSEKAHALHMNKSKIRLFLGGLGSGKTTFGAIESIRLALDEDYAKYHGLPWPNFGWVVGQDFPTVLNNAWREILKWIPEELVLGKDYRINEQLHRIQFPSFGSEGLQFVAANEPDSLRAGNVNWIWVDEAALIKKEAWDNILGRANRGMPCIIFLTGTPKGFNWLYDEVWLPAQNNEPNYVAIKVPSWESGRMTWEDLEPVRKRLSPEWFEQEYGAEFRSFVGLVYREFDPRRHQSEDLPDCPVFYGGLDWGYVDPATVVIAGRHAGGWAVYESWGVTRQDVDVQIEKALELQNRYNVQMFYADPSRPDHISRARSRGLRITTAQNAIAEGIEEVRRYMRQDSNPPGFLIHPRCEGLLNELRLYRYPDTGTRGAHELPIDKDNHYVDPLRYIVYSTRKRSVPKPMPKRTNGYTLNDFMKMIERQSGLDKYIGNTRVRGVF